MAPAKDYRWEAARVATILGIIVTLALQARLTRAPVAATHQPLKVPDFGKLAQVPTVGAGRYASAPAVASDSPQPVSSEPSDPGEMIVGPTGLSNRYTLRSVERRKESAHDVLIVSLHVESLATEGLVSPFESDMLEIDRPGVAPIKPGTPFRSPIPSGNSRDRDVAFNIPSTSSLDRATLRIHYYNYEKEIPLNAAQRLR